ncbi:MAG TPA: non-heme iron oxygenase ferredoxin subunit [Paraburkholderia sp.]|jgi:nitrite reductase/ring-hydroxylating ferredoxin subunit
MTTAFSAAATDTTTAATPAATDDGWHALGAHAVLFAAGPCRGVQIDGQRIGLFEVDGEIFALDDICTHGHAMLSEGELDGHEIECPLHAGVFDVRSGAALCAPLTRDARRYAVKIENDHVFVRIAP